MIAQRSDRGIANLQIFTDGAVLGDVRLDFVAQSFIQRSLPSDRCQSRSLGATTRLFNFAPMFRCKLSHLGSALALAQLVAGASLKLCHVGGFFARQSRALGTHFSFRQTPATAASRAR